METRYIELRRRQRRNNSLDLNEKASRLVLKIEHNEKLSGSCSSSCKNHRRWKRNNIIVVFFIAFSILGIILFSFRKFKDIFYNDKQVYLLNSIRKTDYKAELNRPLGMTVRNIIDSSVKPMFTSFLPFWYKSSLRDGMDNLVEPDYGGLNVTYERSGIPRSIRSNMTYEETTGHHRFYWTSKIEGDDFLLGEEEYLLEYFAFDDDTIRKDNCRKPSWYNLKFPLCNVMHEKNVKGVEDNATLVTNGFYRDVWTLTDEGVMLKTLRYEHTFNLDNVAMIDIDVLIMERLTFSPRISNVYAHCGASVLVERFHGIPIGNLFMEEEREGIEYPTQIPNPGQKLKMALQMAEGIADLHGFLDGVIVHNDIQYPQFLTDNSLNVYLTDFNRADIMFWDEHKSEHCKFFSGSAHGNVRSPEEYANKAVDEKIDVYSFGNVIFSLLSGKEPYDDFSDDLLLSDTIVEGILPKMNGRIKGHSFAESVLFAIMQRCYVYNPENRISIFDVVKLLRKATDLHKNLENFHSDEPKGNEETPNEEEYVIGLTNDDLHISNS